MKGKLWASDCKGGIMYAKQKSDAPVMGVGRKRAWRADSGDHLGGGRSAFLSICLFWIGAWRCCLWYPFRWEWRL